RTGSGPAPRCCPSPYALDVGRSTLTARMRVELAHRLQVPAFLVALLATPHAMPAEPATVEQARALLDELVAIDTSNPPGNEEKAALVAAAALKAAGIEPVIVPFAPGRANLVARLRGDGSKRPLLLLAHLDVVGAAGQP